MADRFPIRLFISTFFCNFLQHSGKKDHFSRIGTGSRKVMLSGVTAQS